MGKKDKKKQKKQPGDWSEDEESTPKIVPAAGAGQEDDDDDDDAPSQPTAASRFSFANLGGDDDEDANKEDDDDDEEGGGLMAAIKSSEKRKKDKKKNKKGGAAAGDDEEDGGEAAAVDLESKAPIEMTTDQLMEEEFGPSKPAKKGKKGKKGKQQQAIDYDDDDFLDQKIKELTMGSSKSEDASPAVAAAADEASPAKEDAQRPATPAKDDGEDEADDGAPKLLSKKEKERLKKEKEKAKKKAAAAAKKAAAGGNANEDAPEGAATSASTPAPKDAAAEEGEDAGEEGEGAATGSSSKNKKKKKKAGAAKEEAAFAKEAPAKKVPAHIAAMRAALEKKKQAEEEARRAEEEERRRIEEEEARAAEAERLKEEEKKRKKEKEKAKIEQLKKEGKYMTPKQKQEAAAANARRDAMIASGQIKVEGLEQGEVEAPKVKKPTYGKKKPQKKQQQNMASSVASLENESPSGRASPVVEEPTISEDLTRSVEHEPSEAAAAAEPAVAASESKEDIKDDWDASSEDEKTAEVAKDAQEELDDWDAESEEEKEEVKKPETKTKATEPATTTSAKASSTKAATPAKQAVNGTSTKGPAAASTKSGPSASPAKAAPAKGAAAAAKKAQEDSEDESDSDEDDSDEDSDEDSGSDSDDSSESSDEERITSTARQAAQRKAEAAARREQKRKDAIAASSKDDLRSPICCILGHVDTGKTKLLDKIRQTNVQEGEAGGITQQIGATYFPVEAIQRKTSVLGEHNIQEFKLPGLLVIDTPGHESFTNLRTRGSSLCNIAILVVDIMHGLEPQTLESIRLLRAGKTPFIVALNKIDRLYGWQATPDGAFRDSLAKQSRAVQNEFDKRLKETQLAFSEQGLNAVPYYENTNFSKFVSLVPTSAHTGEGVPDMLMLIVKLTQERMSSQLMYISELDCTVLEVKVIEGLGTTLDVVLSNGVLHEGDKIVVCGLNGPIVTQVRALLTPQPLKELRVKGQYVHHPFIKAAMGIKIVAPDLEKAIAGSRLLVCGPDDDEEDLKDEVMEDLQTIMKSVDRSGKGVYVQASTLGSLEALLEFLRTSKIPVSGINIGPVHKKDITRTAVMLDRAPEFAVVLAFDVPIDKDAAKMADELGIKVFSADIIYHLFDAFTKHNAEVLEARRKDSAPNAVWPCRLKILKCFAKRDPIIVGCDIIEGSLRVGTPICVIKTDAETKKKEIIKLGKVTGLEINHKQFETVKKSQVGAGVAVKIESAVYETARLFGRHFDEKDELISLISRESIDTLKDLFRADATKEDWVLIKKLKPLLDIP